MKPFIIGLLVVCALYLSVLIIKYRDYPPHDSDGEALNKTHQDDDDEFNDVAS